MSKKQCRGLFPRIMKIFLQKTCLGRFDMRLPLTLTAMLVAGFLFTQINAIQRNSAQCPAPSHFNFKSMLIIKVLNEELLKIYTHCKKVKVLHS